MGVMKSIAKLGKYVGKGEVRCIDCAELDQEQKCHGVPMVDIDQPRSCLFFRQKKGKDKE